MPKVRSSALTAFVVVFQSTLATAAIPPVERLEGESVSEDDGALYDENYYLGDDNPYAPASDGDSDLGQQVILDRHNGRAPVRLKGNAFLFWSNNTNSAGVGEDDGWYFGGSASARWKHRLTGLLYLDTYAYQDAYFYDSDNLNFQTTELGLGLATTLPSLGDLSVFGRYEFRFTGNEHIHEPVALKDAGAIVLELTDGNGQRIGKGVTVRLTHPDGQARESVWIPVIDGKMDPQKARSADHLVLDAPARIDPPLPVGQYTVKLAWENGPEVERSVFVRAGEESVVRAMLTK